MPKAPEQLPFEPEWLTMQVHDELRGDYSPEEIDLTLALLREAGAPKAQRLTDEQIHKTLVDFGGITAAWPYAARAAAGTAVANAKSPHLALRNGIRLRIEDARKATRHGTPAPGSTLADRQRSNRARRDGGGAA